MIQITEDEIERLKTGCVMPYSPAQHRRAGGLGVKLSLADRHYERGLFYYEKNRLDLALADLDQAIAHNPRKAEYYAARGLILVLLKRVEEAEDDFATALELDPTQWLVYYGRAMIQVEQGNYINAIDLFSRAQRIAPRRPEIYYYRAIAFYLSGSPDEATRDMAFAQTLLLPEDKRYKQAAKWLALFKK